MSELRVGERFSGTAEIVAVLRGGMGIVYVCRGRLHAIRGPLDDKMIQDPSSLASGDVYASRLDELRALLRRRFVKEATISASLPPHPNVVPTLDVREWGGSPYILMPFVNGPPLRSLIVPDGVNLQAAIAYARQACSGLVHVVDKHDIVHGDIKPDNVLIDQSGRVQIADFGLAKTLAAEAAELISQDAAKGQEDPRLTSLRMIGTLDYAAPELLSFAPHSRSTDIYSFGVLLYEILTGSLPFERRFGQSVAQWTQHGIPPPPSRIRGEITEDIDYLVMRCLSLAPDHRFSTFEEVQDQLNQATRAKTTMSVSPLLGVRETEFTLSNHANAYVNLGLNQRAIDILDDETLRSIRSAPLWLLKGTALANLGRHELAIECYERALRVQPHLNQALLNKGNSLFALAHNQKSRSLYEKALQVDPSYEFALHSIGAVLASEGQHLDAIGFFDRVLMIDDSNVKSWVAKADALISLGRTQEAQDWIQDTRRIDMNSPQVLLYLAVLYFKLGELAKAREFSRRCLQARDRDDINVDDVANVLLRSAAAGTESEVIEVLEMLATIEPDNHFVLQLCRPGTALRSGFAVMRAKSLRDSRNLPAALHVVNNALLEDPESEGLLVIKGALLEESNRFEEAIEVYDYVLTRNPANPSALQYKGVALCRLNRFEEALSICDRALLAKPRDEYTLRNRALVLVKLGSPRRALEDCENAAKVNPASAETWRLMAEIQMELGGDMRGRLTEAIQALERAYSLEPNPDTFYRLVDYLREAQDLERALSLCDEFAAARPCDPMAWTS